MAQTHARTHVAYSLEGLLHTMCQLLALPMDHEIKLSGKFTFIFIYAIIINDRNVKQKPIFQTIIRNRSS